jgi:hypothetical protein
VPLGFWTNVATHYDDNKDGFIEWPDIEQIVMHVTEFCQAYVPSRVKAILLESGMRFCVHSLVLLVLCALVQWFVCWLVGRMGGWID